MSVNLTSDTYKVKQILKKNTQITKGLKVGDFISFTSKMNPFNYSFNKLQSLEFQLIVNSKKTNIFIPQRKILTILKDYLEVETAGHNISSFNKRATITEEILKEKLSEDDFIPLEKMVTLVDTSDLLWKDIQHLLWSDNVIDFSVDKKYVEPANIFTIKILYDYGKKILVTYKIECYYRLETNEDYYISELIAEAGE